VGTPVLDVATAQIDFRLPVQINNTLLDNSSGGQINTNSAYIQSLEMTYIGTAIQQRTRDLSITVPASGSSGAVLPLIRVQDFPALAPPGGATTNIVVNVRAHGILASQDAFTTAWFQVPVSVCAGCLASNFTCTPPAFLVTCPSAATPGVQPGQTATPACATLQ
jgi:hypothetical protein